MNNQFKKGFAVLLAVLMIASIVPFGAFAAKTCDHDVNDDSIWEIQSKTPATCTTDGEVIRVCKKCAENGVQQTDKRPLPRLGHDLEGVPYTVERAATCKEKGIESKVCKRCEQRVEQRELNTVAHTKTYYPTSEYLAAAANCSSPALYYYYCSTCKSKLTETYENGQKNPDYHAHLIDATIPHEATCQEKGNTAGEKCADCGTVITQPEEIAIRGHVAIRPATCTTPAVCEFCKTEFVASDPTNHVLYDKNGNAVNQEETNAAVDPTCTKTGLTEGKTCKACGTVTVPQKERPVADHTLVSITGKKATCTEAGLTDGQKCSVCEEITKQQETIPATGHSTADADWIYPKDFDCTKGGERSKTCTVCGATGLDKETVAKKNHTTETIPAVPATCEQDGAEEGTRCTVCGITVKDPEKINKLEHNYSGEVIPAENHTHKFKCVNGCERYDGIEPCYDSDNDCVCDTCGSEMEHRYGNYVYDGNATCVADGTETRTCIKCGVKKETRTAEGSSAEKGAHSYTNYIYDENSATCESDGTETAKCDYCDSMSAPRIKEGSKLGHIDNGWVYPNGFDCTEGGTSFKQCPRCEKVFEIRTLEPGTHVEVGDAAVAPTCTTSGITAGSHCEICKQVVTPQTVVPALEHAYMDTVLKAATCQEQGEKKCTCINCGDTYTDVIPVSEHSGEWTVAREATCEQTGFKFRKCTVCGEEESIAIDKLAHVEVVDEGYPATCTESGISNGKHCVLCNNVTVEQVEIAAKGHTKKVTTTPATTSKAGKTVTTCSVCKVSLKSTVTIAKIATVKLSQTKFEYDGKAKKPTVTVKDANGKTLKSGTDYTVKYDSGRKKIGTYSVVITFKGNYSGKKTLKFYVTAKIVTGLKATAAKKSATLKWEKGKYATKYAVYYSTSKNGTYKKLGTTTKLTYTAKNLKSGKTYYFYVKTIKSTDNGNIYSDPSAIKKAKIK